MSSLRVAVAQPRTITGDPAANARAHAMAIVRASADLVVFPETSLTGYDLAAPAVQLDDPCLAPLVEACRAAGSTALVGAVVSAGVGPAIGALAVRPGGVELAYLKMSLGDAESTCFAAGVDVAVIQVDGWRIGIGICKDTRIADHLDRTMALGVDLYAAGLAHAPNERAELAVRARRIAARYGVPVAFAGFAGPTGGGYPQTCGGSGIWSRDGRLLGQLGPEPGEVLTIELAPSAAARPAGPPRPSPNRTPDRSA